MNRGIVGQPVVMFQRLDLVQLGGGQRIIVTAYNPSRPKNCYSGVLENGQGKEYVFGAKHSPRKVGTVTEGHPALLNNRTRMEGRNMPSGFTPMVKNLVTEVFRQAENGKLNPDDHFMMLELARNLRDMGFGGPKVG